MTITRPVNGDFLDPAWADEIADAIEALQALTAAYTPLHVFKSADGTPFSNTTTLANDEDLVLTPTINLVYTWRCIVAYGAGTTADLKLAWTFPAGCRLDYIAYGTDVTAGGNAPVETLSMNETSGTSKLFGGAGVGSFRYVDFHGRLAMGSTAGSLRLQRAQSTATVENTLIKAGSWFTMTKVA